MLEDAPYGTILPRPLASLCVSGLVKPAQWINNCTRLTDPLYGDELSAKTYPDATEELINSNALNVFVLNFWQPKGIDRIIGPENFEQTASLTSLGFILTRMVDSGVI